MKLQRLIPILLLGLVAACAKKEGAETGTAEEATAEKQNVSKATQAEITAVQQKIEKAQYDEVVAGIVKAQAVAQSEADQWAVRKQIQDSHEALLEKAQTDQRAREAYNNLGKLLQGR